MVGADTYLRLTKKEGGCKKMEKEKENFHHVVIRAFWPFSLSFCSSFSQRLKENALGFVVTRADRRLLPWTWSKQITRREIGKQVRQSSGDLPAYLSLNHLLIGILSCSWCYFVQIQLIFRILNVTDRRTDGRTDEPKL